MAGSMDELIARVKELLGQKQPIRVALPDGGRLHVDRPLPFLCVYRRPPSGNDSGTEKMVVGEASYLITSGEKRFERRVLRLIRVLAEGLSAEFGAFLIVEIFSRPLTEPIHEGGVVNHRPGFRILTSRSRSAATTVETLAGALRRIKILKRRATVEIVHALKRSPLGLSELMPAKEERKFSCFTIGIEVKSVYRDPESHEVYPLLLRTLHRGVARALKQCFFEFSRTQTTHHTITYQALGKRALVRAVWEADRRLAEIGSSFDLLLQATPTNVDSAWNRFRRSRFDKVPTFFYRPRTVDPAVLKRSLYQISLDRIEDPTLAALFREKQLELDRQLTLLGDRGTKKFLYGSLQLYGNVGKELDELARGLLLKLAPRAREKSGGKKLKAPQFAEEARGEIERYRIGYPAFTARVEIRDDIVGLMVSRGDLLVGSTVEVPTTRVEALLQHEVGTHVLTYFNGRAQPFQQLHCGLTGYDELQEGLAVFSEYLVGGLSRPRLRLLAGRVLAVKSLTDGATFIETFRMLNRDFGFEQRSAFTITVRVYRAGGLTKDAIYLRGLAALFEYLKNGATLEELFVGKIAVRHVPIIRELSWRHVLRPIPLRPRYLDHPEAEGRINRVRERGAVLDLV